MQKSACHNASVSDNDGKKICDVCGHECDTVMADEEQKDAGGEQGSQESGSSGAGDQGTGEGQGSSEGEKAEGGEGEKGAE